MTRKRPKTELPNRCVLVADGARARFFTIIDADEDTGARLLEHHDLVNPEGTLADRELFSDTSSGRRNRSSVAGGGYSLADNMDRARIESHRRFARELADTACEFIRSKKAGQLVIVATPRFLGVLRPEIRRRIPKGTRHVELRGDVSVHPLPQIEAMLERHGVLSGVRRAPAIYRPRAQPVGS